MVRDLEELLLGVSDADERKFLTEAVKCYHAGAFRAVIVIAVAAGMDGLRRRLSEMATVGGSAGLKDSQKEIERKFAAQDCYEREAIDAARKHAGLVTPAEGDRLHLLFDLRNKCAHPSGYEANAEEARAAIAVVVDLILSRPSSFGFARVSEIIATLKSPLLFPEGKSWAEVAYSEIAKLDAKLLPKLAELLTVVIGDDASVALVEHRNATAMLAGIAALDDSKRSVVGSSKGFRQLALKVKASEAILSVLRVVPLLLLDVDELTRFRFLGLVCSTVKEPTAQATLGALLKSGVLTPEEVEKAWEAVAQTVRTPWAPHDGVNRSMAIGCETLIVRLLSWVVDECVNGDFGTENASIDCIQALAPDVAVKIPDDARATYVLNCGRAGDGTCHAWSADALMKHGLGPRADFADALLAVSVAHPERVVPAAVHGLEPLAKILRASGRVDVLEAVLSTLIAAEPRVLWPAYLGLCALRGWSEPGVSGAAKALLISMKADPDE